MNKSIVPGQPATVSQLANSSAIFEADIDEQLFNFNSDDTPLMNLMLRAKRVKVSSPEVDHFMIDEPKASVFTASAMKGGSTQSPLPLASSDQEFPRAYTTLLAKGITAYAADGKTELPGTDMMLFVTGTDPATNNPLVRAVNGKKENETDEMCVLPDIPKGTEMVILANSLYETQKEVDPDLIVPQAQTIYLQKRGMNQVVSDYFDSQRKRIPFSKAVIAERAIANFKVRGNRTLWAGHAGKFSVPVPRMGSQTVYTTEGLRWQFKREVSAIGEWTVERLIGLAKVFFTGEDVPKTGLLLAGKQLLERLQCIDYSNHPEVQIHQTTNSLGWSVTQIHTVFGDIQIKREPTLDRLGWGGSGALIGEDRLVHYVYSNEHSFSDRVEGEEATRSGILIWDALALKGTCHLWLNGDEEPRPETIQFWGDSETAPTAEIGSLFYLTADCEAISPAARQGEIWIRKTSGWDLYKGDLIV